MANINGWGRGGWGDGAWGTPLPVELTGLESTAGVGSVEVSGVANVEVTGLQTTAGLGAVTARRKHARANNAMH